MIEKQEILSLITTIGYKQSSSNSNYYFKKYTNEYTIGIDFAIKKICYVDTNSSSPIKLGDTTTSNFENSENFVVLECVDRLLDKGYSPSSITLEHKWGLGRKEKGKLDILISKDDNVYLMIECKTWGYEFQKEEKRMLSNGGQLFTYFNQDKHAKYVCLYSSKVCNGKVEYKSNIVKITDDFKKLANVEEIYNRWNKQFSYNGIFESDIKPYMIQTKALIKKDLKKIGSEDGKKIYNQFLEILRHNVVSDKPNAFNKIFNLFVCKVYDEDNSNDNEELQFQWKEGVDNYEIFIDRLNIIYKKGMNSYLKKDIFYVSLQEIEQAPETKLKEYLKNAMIYRNQEFSFIEVFNKNDFNRNSAIIKEIVELLQNYKFRYTEKHQFLGDFFENLLNTGFKQEAGQFFTPRILTRFIISSLPVENIIEQKVINKERDFIPKIIDFACGSGHFLTESMDIVQKSLINIENKNLALLDKIKYELHHYNKAMDKFLWAKESIYGVENDYRLVKTAKLSCFFNGDGEANILQASGIAPFSCDEYRGSLLDSQDCDKCEKFDILVSNPPYSVDGFKAVMDKRNSEETFTLYQYILDTSKEIEVLFIERMKQILKPLGYAAIILPISILQNDGLYAKARQIIFENFYVKAVLKLGSNTFQATHTNTVCLFLQKRKEYIKLDSKDDYIKMCDNSHLLICDTGEKETEKAFLGYSFSTRRGSEGITEKRDENGKYLGMLLNEDNIYDKNKANYYILNAMYNKYLSIPKELDKHIYVMPLQDCFNFDTDDFLNRVSLSKKKIIKSKYDIILLKDIASITKGTTITKAETSNGNIPVIAGGKTPAYFHSKYNQEPNCITVSASGSAGYIWFHDCKIWASDCNVIRSLDENKYITKFIYYCLKKQQNIIYDLKQGSNQTHVYDKDLALLSIPNIHVNVQQEIVKKIEEYEKVISEQETIITRANDKIDSFRFDGYTAEYKLSDTNKFLLFKGKRVLKKDIKKNAEYPIYSANVHKPFGYTDKLLSQDFKLPSVLWGIDGNWMTNYIPPNTPFYPTDHCGVIRCIDNTINHVYLTYALYDAGKQYGFNRHLRPSDSRIKTLTISAPDIEKQNEIGNTILSYKDKIAQSNKIIKEIQNNIDNLLADIIDVI